MKNELSEPDYEFWCKLDEWSLKEAALLLKDFDPLHYRKMQFNLREFPKAVELKEAYLIFLVFKKFEWQERQDRNAAHPFEIYLVATEKS